VLEPMANDSQTENSGQKYIADKTRREEMAEAIQTVADEFGEPLQQTEYRRYRAEIDSAILSINSINYEYDSWVDACEEAGVEPTTSKTRYTIEEACQAIRDAAEEMGEPLKQTEYLAWRESVSREAIHPTTISNAERFSSWQDVCEQAGVETYRK